MTELAAVYRADMTEADTRIRQLEQELDRWKGRVRELEDAILIHRDVPRPKQMHDEWLYDEMGDLWT